MNTQECRLELKGASEEKVRRERFEKQSIKQMKRLLITEGIAGR